MNLIGVPGRVVEFEDGHVVNVESFRIGRRCITVGEFVAFQKLTSFVTTAERACRKTFLDNELLVSFSNHERLTQPAFCLSFVDAMAFCEYYDLRLPLEEEWLAASLVDQGVWLRRADCPLCDDMGNIVLEKLADAIQLCYEEWTATEDSGGIVTRSGPKYFRDAEWQEYVLEHRKIRPVDYCDIMTSFRVCQK
jgi:Sulfatase-modifying factor enzyme 1